MQNARFAAGLPGARATGKPDRKSEVLRASVTDPANRLDAANQTEPRGQISRAEPRGLVVGSFD